ncbi:MAG: methionine adenosyltransferase [Candidatus Omnitrophica bacterium]|nr:methionine adenosyltransferase [Candidatus Omnitrophota bacterium]MBU2044420.1 methionine adenosyltransferase [Candidatus Omnitrophota bacterium]MBU2251372.1 methionine adenosyltransferase [Candidatus Omnitrophota bacterium]MBU2473740.1 methionine adenosyltransferase [Candidatus Omnitrophota bacterium]
MKSYFASESVTEGHPDKVCDQISDAVLDMVLTNDTKGRVACEALVTRGLVIVAGEITTDCYVGVPKLVRKLLKDIGYDDPAVGFDYESCGVMTAIQEQSADIALGVDTGGAGDQGLMFGFANNETPELMPMPIMLSHKLVRRLSAVRKDGTLSYLRPDGKSQVSVEYENGIPKRVDAIVIGAHHTKDVKTEDLRADVRKLVIDQVVPKQLLDSNSKIFINGTGRFEIGGPVSDTGVTGRKIIVDTYGGYARHGGGAFSGKDPTKVDRSASYVSRYVAKNIVKAGIATACEVQLSYCIGVAEPVSVNVNTFGTAQVDEVKIAKAVREVFKLTPAGIIQDLKLLQPIYTKAAAYGHFGREDEGFTWENTDKVDQLKRALR